jgi:hypothetical protein
MNQDIQNQQKEQSPALGVEATRFGVLRILRTAGLAAVVGYVSFGVVYGICKVLGALVSSNQLTGIGWLFTEGAPVFGIFAGLLFASVTIAMCLGLASSVSLGHDVLKRARIAVVFTSLFTSVVLVAPLFFFLHPAGNISPNTLYIALSSLGVMFWVLICFFTMAGMQAKNKETKSP